MIFGLKDFWRTRLVLPACVGNVPLMGSSSYQQEKAGWWEEFLFKSKKITSYYTVMIILVPFSCRIMMKLGGVTSQIFIPFPTPCTPTAMTTPAQSSLWPAARSVQAFTETTQACGASLLLSSLQSVTEFSFGSLHPTASLIFITVYKPPPPAQESVSPHMDSGTRPFLLSV